jgi:hypothetical protein
MPKLYRYAGFENVALRASILADGVVISAPGVGNSIYILGTSSYDDIRLTETNASGNLIVVSNAGMSDFPATIRVKENTAIHLIGNGTGATVFYYIDNA